MNNSDGVNIGNCIISSEAKDNAKAVRLCKKCSNYYRSLCGAKRLWFFTKKVPWNSFLGRDGKEPIKMPWGIALGLVCDLLGAGASKAGGIENLSMKERVEWWDSRRDKMGIHEDTMWLVDMLFQKMRKNKIENTLTDSAYLEKLRSTYEN